MFLETLCSLIEPFLWQLKGSTLRGQLSPTFLADLPERPELHYALCNDRFLGIPAYHMHSFHSQRLYECCVERLQLRAYPKVLGNFDSAVISVLTLYWPDTPTHKCILYLSGGGQDQHQNDLCLVTFAKIEQSVELLQMRKKDVEKCVFA